MALFTLGDRAEEAVEGLKLRAGLVLKVQAVGWAASVCLGMVFPVIYWFTGPEARVAGASLGGMVVGHGIAALGTSMAGIAAFPVTTLINISLSATWIYLLFGPALPYWLDMWQALGLP